MLSSKRKLWILEEEEEIVQDLKKSKSPVGVDENISRECSNDEEDPELNFYLGDLSENEDAEDLVERSTEPSPANAAFRRSCSVVENLYQLSEIEDMYLEQWRELHTLHQEFLFYEIDLSSDAYMRTSALLMKIRDDIDMGSYQGQPEFLQLKLDFLSTFLKNCESYAHPITEDQARLFDEYSGYGFSSLGLG